MVRIIESNLSLDDDKNLKDHQSRIVLANCWEDYINAFINYNGQRVEKFKSETFLSGCSIGQQCKIENLKYDKFHLSCEIIKWNNTKDTRIAYLINM